MRNTGKRYSEDFKKMIVEVYNTEKPRKEICDQYGITAASVTNWMNKVLKDMVLQKFIKFSKVEASV